MSDNVSRILVVDDDAQITQVLQASFTAHGYEVRTADDGIAALKIFQQWQPNLIVTDLSMPEMGGMALCQAIRACSDIPVIVLSVKGQEKIKVQSLDCGADDFVTKPFGTDELLARVRVALRRVSAASLRTDLIEMGDFHVDLTAHRVEIQGKEIHLTPKEFELLTFLLRNAGRVLTHKNLLAAIWGRAYADQPDTVRMLVRQLRRKIEPNPAIPQYLKTEPWIGYRFEPAK